MTDNKKEDKNEYVTRGEVEDLVKDFRKDMDTFEKKTKKNSEELQNMRVKLNEFLHKLTEIEDLIGTSMDKLRKRVTPSLCRYISFILLLLLSLLSLLLNFL